MKQYILIIALIFGCTLSASAQKVPTPSPKCTIIQEFALGEVKVEYSRPSAKGREIWGSLVPYGEVWRTGANYPTFLTFSDTFFVEGNKINPGNYALYTIPEQGYCTIILSANTKLWGAYGYTDKDDVMRAKVKTSSGYFTETFTISFINIMDDKMIMNLSWGEVIIPIKIKAEIAESIITSYKEKLENTTDDASIYWKGAEFLRTHNQNLDLALQWAIKATEIEDYWGHLWTVAQIYAAQGNINEAIIWGNKALNKGRENKKYFTYENTYSEQIKEWENSK